MGQSQYSESNNSDGTQTLSYVSHLREDFVNCILRITLDTDKRVLSLFFSSNTHGTCLWENGRGVINVHRWEDEDNVQHISTLSRHYTTLLLNGEMPKEHAQLIIKDVLTNLTDQNLHNSIEKITQETQSSTIFSM